MQRLPSEAHTAQPWRIHEFVPDFEVEDVWSFRTPGAGPGDFPEMLAAIRSAGGPGSSSRLTGWLFALRWRLGTIFGWDREGGGLDGRVQPLRTRVPGELRATADGEPRGVFSPVYRLPRESAAEIANGTVHAVMHLGWVPSDAGGYELRMAVLVRPNGWFGRAYMAAIRPFRYLIVYPSLGRQWERAWLNRRGEDRSPTG